jgi:hypothetical protein
MNKDMNKQKIHGIAAFVLIILWPSITQAHLVNTGLGPFYDGVSHLAMSPDDLLSAVALALLAGLSGARAGRNVLFLLPPVWLLGGLFGLRVEQEVSLALFSILSFLVAGADPGTYGLLRFSARILKRHGHGTGRRRLSGALWHFYCCLRVDRTVFGPGRFPQGSVVKNRCAGCRELDSGDRSVDAWLDIQRDKLRMNNEK